MYYNTEGSAYGDDFPALRRSSSDFLSAANRQNVSKAMVGLRVTPEIIIGSRAYLGGTLHLRSLSDGAREEARVAERQVVCELASFVLLKTGI